MKDKFGDVKELLERVVADHVLPGVVVAAVVDGELVHAEACGYRDLEQKLPVTEDTPSRWYSISKPITAVAWGRLVESGKVKWDTPVKELLPELRFSDPVATERATIRDLLLHRTGMVGGGWFWMGEVIPPEVMMERIPHVPCTPGFRAGFHYQNLNFTILAEAMKTLGTNWHDAIKETLGVLGVKPLTSLKEFVEADRMLGYGPSGFSPPERLDDFDFEACAGASAICGSVKELAQVARMIALGGTVDGNEVVSESMWKELVQPVVGAGDPSWPEMCQASLQLAGHRVAYRGEVLCSWAGGFSGWTAQIEVLPGRKAAGVALVNRSASPASDALGLEMLDRAAGWDALPWADRFLEQKRKLRAAGPKKLEERLARPVGEWPCSTEGVCGSFEHPAYGSFSVERTGEEVRMRFRHVDLPMQPREDGTVSVDGSHQDATELMWDLKPIVEGDEVAAWDFGPDGEPSICRFERKV